MKKPLGRIPARLAQGPALLLFCCLHLGAQEPSAAATPPSHFGSSADPDTQSLTEVTNAMTRTPAPVTAVSPAPETTAAGTGRIIDSRGHEVRWTFSATPSNPQAVADFLAWMDEFDREHGITERREEEERQQRRQQEEQLAEQAAEQAAAEAAWQSIYGNGPFAGYPYGWGYGWGGSGHRLRPPHRPSVGAPSRNPGPLGPSPIVPARPMVPPTPSFQLPPMSAWPYPTKR